MPLNPWEEVPTPRVTITAHATVEVRCRCGMVLPLASTIPGVHSTTVCPDPGCQREYHVDRVRVCERYTSRRCPEERPDEAKCAKGGYQDTRCDLWQACGWREQGATT